MFYLHGVKSRVHLMMTGVGKKDYTQQKKGLKVKKSGLANQTEF